EVTATGEGAEDVLRALEELAGTQFGDAPGEAPEAAPEESGATPAPAGPPARGSGLDGAIGTVRRPDAPVDLTAYRPGDPSQERDRLEQALSGACEQLA